MSWMCFSVYIKDKFQNLYRAMGLSQEEDLGYSVKRHEEKSSEELIDVDTVDNSAAPLLPPPKKKDNKSKWVFFFIKISDVAC